MALHNGIESGVPLSVAKRLESGPRGKRGSIYPFADMKVGDSFLVPYNGRERTQLGANMATCARNWLGKGNFRTARMDDGIRVWRIA